MEGPGIWYGSGSAFLMGMQRSGVLFQTTPWKSPCTCADVQWTFTMSVFPATSEVELIDVKNRRAFLRKSRCDGLNVQSLHVGGKATVFGRQLDIVDYGDGFTRNILERRQQRCVPIPTLCPRHATDNGHQAVCMTPGVAFSLSMERVSRPADS
jgi:hypothetical protein